MSCKDSYYNTRSYKTLSGTPPLLNINNSTSFYANSCILSTVDSIPNEHDPPSKIATSDLPSWAKSAYTCSAFDGETCPNLLAEGAATGTYASRMSL